MSEACTSVAVEDLAGDALEWALSEAREPGRMPAWKWLARQKWSRYEDPRHDDLIVSMALISKHAVSLEPVDAFTEGGAGWWAVCLDANGDRCRYLGDTIEIAVRRAVVGALAGEHIDIPNQVLEHCS